MTESMSEFIYTLWAEECVRMFGHTLDINTITAESVGYTCSDDEDPLITMDGDVTRSFRVRYDREVFIDEKDYS